MARIVCRRVPPVRLSCKTLFSCCVRFVLLAGKLIAACFSKLAICSCLTIQYLRVSPRLRRCIILYIITFPILIPFTMYYVPYSPLFDYMVRHSKVLNYYKAVESWKVENEWRRAAAQDFLLNFERVQSSKASLCTTVVTTTRHTTDSSAGPAEYLTQTMERLLRAERDSGVSLHLHLCHVDSSAPSGEFRELLKFADAVSSVSELADDQAREPEWKTEQPMRFNLNLTEMAKKSREIGATKKRKECIDYAFCIARALLLCNSQVQTLAEADASSDVDRFLSQYLLVLEDDAAVHKDALQTLRNILRRLHLLIPSHREIKVAESIGFVKLYHPLRLTDYFKGLEVDRVPELAGLALLFGFLLTISYFRVFERRWRRIFDYDSSCLLLAMVIYSFLVLALLGRHTVAERLRSLSAWSHLIVGPAPACCTPAMLYSRSHADLVVNHLFKTCSEESDGTKCSKDMLLHDLMLSSQLRTYYVYPSLVDHIGLLSTMGSYALHPYIAA